MRWGSSGQSIPIIAVRCILQPATVVEVHWIGVLRSSARDRDVHLRGGQPGTLRRSNLARCIERRAPCTSLWVGTPAAGNIYRRRRHRWNSPRRWLGRHAPIERTNPPLLKVFGAEASQRNLQAMASQHHLGPVTPPSEAPPWSLPCCCECCCCW